MMEDHVATPGLAHRAMAPELDLLADIMGGTQKMRLAGARWPPQTKNYRPKPKITKERNAMSSLSLLALLGRIFDPLAALLDEAATSTRAREVARVKLAAVKADAFSACLLYTSPSPRDAHESRMPSFA